MKPINVGVIGFGTIGSGVVEALVRKRSYLKRRTGIDIRLKAVCDRDIISRRPYIPQQGLLTRDTGKILGDSEIDIVVELIGGIHPAKEIIKGAIKSGKHVVTANKALLCEEGEELFNHAAQHERVIKFEGGVGGGIPIIKSLKEGLVSNDIRSIYGIVNGTSNYILWRMDTGRCDFKKALSDARKMGVAEKNAGLDVNGTDSAHKLALLALLGFGRYVSLKDIYVEGIEDIEPCDIEYAKDLGYSIKLLAITKRDRDEIELRVHPTLVSQEHPLSSVRGVYNAIYVKGDYIGETLFYGKGAGRYPTASAVLSDVLDLAGSISRGCARSAEIVDFPSGIKRVKPIEKIRSRYYVRFQAVDRPGVLASVSSVLARHRISIASVKQAQWRSRKAVPIIMLTHEALEKSMAKALTRISGLSCITPKPVAIRIEKF